MNRLLRQGHTDTTEPDAWLPRWTAGDPLSPALRHTHRVHSAIRVADLDDTWAWAVTGEHIVKIGRADGHTQAIRLDGDAPYRPAGVFHGDTVVLLEHERLLVFDRHTGALLLATDPDDVPRRAGNLVRVAVTGTTAVTGTDQGCLLHWDLTDGRLLARSAAHDDFVSLVAISPGPGPIVVSLGGFPQNRIAFHHLDRLRHLAAADVPEDTTAGCWSGPHPLTLDKNGHLTTWDPTTASAVRRVSAPAGDPVPGGDHLLITRNAAVNIVDPQDGTVHGTLRTDLTGGINAVAVHGDMLFAAGDHATNLLQLTDPLPHDAPDRTPILTATRAVVGGADIVIAIGGDGRRQGYDLHGRALDLPSGDPTQEYGYVGGYPSLAADQHGRLAIMNHLAPVVVDLATGHTRRAPRTLPDQSILWGLALHDGILAALTIGGTLALWDADSLDLLAHTSVGPSAHASTIALADGVVLVGYQNGVVRRLDRDTLTDLDPVDVSGIDVSDLYGPYAPGAVRCLRVSGDTVIAAAGDTVTSTDGPDLVHPSSVLDCLAATVDGVPVVVTSCADKQLRIWEGGSGRLVRTVAVEREVFRILGAATGTIVVQDHEHLAGLGPVPTHRL